MNRSNGGTSIQPAFHPSNHLWSSICYRLRLVRKTLPTDTQKSTSTFTQPLKPHTKSKVHHRQNCHQKDRKFLVRILYPREPGVQTRGGPVTQYPEYDNLYLARLLGFRKCASMEPFCNTANNKRQKSRIPRDRL